MLGRLKRWLLAMLALPHTQYSLCGQFQSFCRECGTGLRVAPVPPRRAALLTRPALRGVLEVSGRRASRKSPPFGRVRLACGASNKGHDEGREQVNK